MCVSDEVIQYLLTRPLPIPLTDLLVHPLIHTLSPESPSPLTRSPGRSPTGMYAHIDENEGHGTPEP